MNLKLYKASYALALLLSTVYMQSQAQSLNTPGILQPQAPITNSNKSIPLPDGADAEWFSNASAEIKKMQYDFKSENVHNGYKIINTVNQIQFSVDHDGYVIGNTAENTNQQEWKAAFNVISAGRNSVNWTPGLNYQTEDIGNTVRYGYPALNIEYINNESGIRQNFVVKKKFEGTGALRINIQIDGDLKPVLLSETALGLQTKTNSVLKLTYEDLKVWDANQKMLPAKMELDRKSGMLSIVVDDSQAAYPITIDPLNKTPEWQTSADGILPALLNTLNLQVQAMYGWTVSGIGDVNNDGYADAAVSAPLMADVLTGMGSLTGVGAVFIYYGTPAGLPATPNKVLQPNGAIAGALFGYSVSGGDVTGDGINDLVIGAPLDGVDVNFGGGTGILNGKVGKVYVYQGGSLTGMNPAPFLNVSLNSSLLTSTTITLNSLFGFSVAVAGDMNGDGKGEIVVGAPTYARISGITAVKTGGAFILLSDAGNTFSNIVSLDPPTGSLLGLHGAVGSLVSNIPLVGGALWAIAGPVLSPLLNGQIDGLLFGYSVDGAGRYNNDAHNDVVIGAPAGVNLGQMSGGLSLDILVSNLLSGQVLGGTAYVFGGTGNASGVNSTAIARFQASSSGLLSNAANLFGMHVRGVENAFGVRNGNMLISSPSSSVLSNVVGGLQVKAGNLFLFKKQTGAFTNPVNSDQTLSSPRSTSILSILAGKTINMSLLYAHSVDNAFDLNCDGYGDILVGEPLSTSVGLIGVDAVGGAAYVYLGQADGTYQAAPVWQLHVDVSGLLGVNATGLNGYSVAGLGYVKGSATRPTLLVGGPANALDFGTGLLNLGNTMGTLTSFVGDANGLGKAHSYDAALCNLGVLASNITEFTGKQQQKSVDLSWKIADEKDVNTYELQESNNGSDFRVLTMLIPTGKTENKQYSFTDKDVVVGSNYYRLKITDKTGTVKYSQIIVFRFNDQFKGEMVVTPNPVRDVIRVKFSGMKKGNYRTELRNVTGQLIHTANTTIADSEQMSYINKPSSLTSGIYLLTVYSDENIRVNSTKIYVE